MEHGFDRFSGFTQIKISDHPPNSRYPRSKKNNGTRI
jgi:hypothetical protein